MAGPLAERVQADGVLAGEVLVARFYAARLFVAVPLASAAKLLAPRLLLPLAGFLLYCRGGVSPSPLRENPIQERETEDEIRKMTERIMK